MRLTILHTNDIHGRQERIAQIATIVEREKAAADHPVLYLDAGDVEDTTNRLSNITKGAAMHRLLSRAGCDVATVGNACWLRYGPTVLAEHARVASYPLLLANFHPVDGPIDSVIAGDVGILGLTASFEGFFAGGFDFGFTPLPEVELARRLARELRESGAQLVVLLSHLGLEDPNTQVDDRRIARELQGDVDVIVGAHTHDLLPQGEWIGSVLVTQAGEFGEHVGRIEVDGDRITASVEPVPDDTPPHPAVLAEAEVVESEARELLDERIGVLDRPLDAQWVADAVRERMDADVALIAPGQALLGTLPAGPLTRGALWEVCDSAANPGVTRMTGQRLVRLLEKARDPAFEADTPRPLRGRPRGRLHVSGPETFDPEREYVVAGTDWELDPYGRLTEADWNLDVRYDFPTILREAIEEHLRR
jgi:2',3'-cyclic-nucleotide 2'-phosphodiesterase (5'-nucleotidase family)